MVDFWDWVKSRQDARQWSDDEKACAEMAWNEAIKQYKKHQQLEMQITMEYIRRMGK